MNFNSSLRMGLTSNTGLLSSLPQRSVCVKEKSNNIELRCEVTPAPYILRPYAGLYNPFSHGCSVLCNHPADANAKEYVKRVKDAWAHDGRTHCFHEDLSKFQDQSDKDKNRTPHDIVTEDMFRRYTETDSRPHTPAPTLASGKSRGSRRCLTPDQPHPKTTIVVDLRRSHSQETLYYHGYTTSEAIPCNTSTTIDRSTLPSLNLSEATHTRLVKGECEQLPPLASPLVLTKRTTREPMERKKNQLKALNIGKTLKIKKSDIPTSQRSKNDKETNDKADSIAPIDDEGGEIRRRGKRRRKGRGGGSDRLTSAGLAAQAQQDPETQVAGIGTDSHNSSSRPSLAAPSDDVIVLPLVKTAFSKKTDSFLDDDILKFLHREVDEEAIETEFDVKRRYVLEEALRTRPDRALSQEMHALLRELRSPAVCLGDWLHVPRVFSRKNSQFGLPTDSNDLEKLTAMQYASRFVTLKKSKQLLYLTVLRKFRPNSYRMPKKDIQEGLILMMGGIMTHEQATQYESIMEWQHYLDEDFSDEIKLHMLDTYRKQNAEGDTGESVINTIKYRTWCGLCAICERMYGRFPPRDKDPPEGIELSDFTMIETKLSALNVHRGLLEILNTIRSR
ncbi:uncharacterized protein LOC126979618 isoform X1 [Leptidea sinapis]|uniref:uncharacterized protein LOC126979618 isoform X1 n=1 Tax=Leptidea sinapis TaxID=189913 RepID=UPI0021C3ADEB|nr:uncharacterized protein LOC126979618 isoform X1 [Leptidea sinapis]